MPNATQGDGTGVTAPAAVPSSPEIEALRASLVAEMSATFDKRVSGFQRAIGEKDTVISTLQSQLEALQSASLSPDERATLAQEKLAAENAQLRAQIELNQLGSEYGDDILSTYRQLLDAGSAKDQLELLKSIRTPATSAAPVPPVVVPDVDPNNPLRTPGAGLRLDDGSLLTDARADQILGSIGRMADVTQTGARSSSQSGLEE